MWQAHAGDAVAVPGRGDGGRAGPRPDFVVSQFHGDNIAMSWFLVVKEGVAVPAATATASAGAATTTTTYKLIVWGTGNEVPSLLFDVRRSRRLLLPHRSPSVLESIGAGC